MSIGLLLAEWSLELRDPKPVSVNKLYVQDGRKRFLTKEGEVFKAALKRHVAVALMSSASMKWSYVVNAVYLQGAWVELDITLHLDRVLNGGWKVGGVKSRSKKRDLMSPYKKVDATNYAKIIEDAVAEGTGIDDSAHLCVCIRKKADPDDPRVSLTYRVYE